MSKNRLSLEKSPYLKQHKDNPIWWHAWGQDAFDAAKREDKPIFLSIGYATCHWCHVMEGDSFVNEEVAKVLNEKFISIKVDREERPDVDSIYMGAVQSMSGHGGWPLTVFLNTEGKPFWGGTFIPRERFTMLLNEVHRVWTSPEREKLNSGSDEISQHLSQMHKTAAKGDVELSDKLLQKFYLNMLQSFDDDEGGFGEAPKFPSAMLVSMLFRIYKRTQSEPALNMGLQTLDALIRGGINDQLGGGFHRYATDSAWLVPHFEKMLYDNALISLAMLDAYQISENEDYAQATRLTLDYIISQMQDEDGGYYSAEDADSEKAEGKFYVWHYDELKKILSPDEFSCLEKLYGIRPKGNFSTHAHVSALEKAAGLEEVKEANILFLDKRSPLPDRKAEPLKSALKKLKDTREKRIRPLLDHKILTSWNGLMIAAMAKAYQVLGDEKYLQSATKAADFIEKHLMKNGRLLRRFCDGEARFDAYLEDYAFFISGLLELYQASFDPHFINLAQKLQSKQNELFWDDKSKGFFDTDGHDQTLIVRTKEFTDNATPSGNSMAVLNLLKLFTFEPNLKYQEMVRDILGSLSTSLTKYPRAFPQMLQALDFFLDNSKSIVVEGNLKDSETKNVLKKLLAKHFLPNKVLVGKPKKDGKTTIYVCEEGQCKLPTSDVGEAVRQASQINSYTV